MEIETEERQKEKGMSARSNSEGSERRNEGPRVDRRKSVMDKRRLPTGLERRRGPGRRRSDFMRSAEEGEMTQEQHLFLMAIGAYKRVNDRPYPSWTEVLEVVRKLGYRKTCEMTLSLDNCEDWTEEVDAPFASEVQEVPIEP